MIDIKNVIGNINIVLSNASITETALDTLAIMTNSATTQSKLFYSLEEVVEDYGIDTDVYKAALLYYSQSPKPIKLKVVKIADDADIVDTVSTFIAEDKAWYALSILDSVEDADYVSIAQLLDAASSKHMLFITTTNAAELTDAADTLSKKLNAVGAIRTVINYSNTAFASCSVAARILAADLEKANTAFDLKFKKMPGVVAEDYSNTQYRNAVANGVNIYTSIANGTDVFLDGNLVSGAPVDEIFFKDWIENKLQFDILNLFAMTQTKISQTDIGTEKIIAAMIETLELAKTNGILGTGAWSLSQIGAVQTGDVVNGYYVYAPSTLDQSQSDRETRVSVPIQFALKYSGSVRTVDIAGVINR